MSSSDKRTDTRRVALVTGCSDPQSLGMATALELHKRGWRVFATARDAASLQTLQSGGLDTLSLDITSQESVDAARMEVERLTRGRLDLLVNNAGAMGAAAALHTDPAKFAAMFDVNVLGALRMVQAFTPLLVVTANDPTLRVQRTKIVNIGSVISTGAPWYTAYAATKAGLQVMSDVMRKELTRLKIDVITLELGVVNTPLWNPAKDFSVTRDTPPTGPDYFKNASDIIRKVGQEFAAGSKKAPTPAATAFGINALVFRHIIPHVPVKTSDGIWAGITKTDLIQAPSA